ncbi:hypothetical protein CLUG_02036 [Clavispora lusitaniae ATCC 42720]|uniref:Uncharacterized protein n=1 Tax=Clavispora lusitaniae (strain ATCC 42720) TaxID=306902 RepID=C4Y1F4_CLAL4|nr:uncharacterized protein CLUG_02036 [Clavispora lusitaniae ATCC 42720]EEQ37913.1 hypothetical protein CLUG_02036 [Clavispora lusitaniae ATCC 42720]
MPTGGLSGHRVTLAKTSSKRRSKSPSSGSAKSTRAKRTTNVPFFPSAVQHKRSAASAMSMAPFSGTRSSLPRIYGRLWVLLKKPSSWRNGAPKSARTTSAWYILGPINLWSGSATAKSPNARVKWLTSLSSSVSAASFWMYSSGSSSARSRRIAASWSNSTTARCADSENTLPWVQMVPAGGWAKRRSRPINVHLSAMRSAATPCTCRSSSRAYVSQWPGAKPKSTTLCTDGRKRLKWRSKAAMVEWAV